MNADQRQMVAQIAGAKDWVARPLHSFAIQKMTEVYRTDEDGRRTKSIGYFKNPDIAKAFAGQQADAYSYKTAEALVLTNGIVGFLLANDAVNIFDDEEVLLEIRNKAAAKLSNEERKVLGLL